MFVNTHVQINFNDLLFRIEGIKEFFLEHAQIWKIVTFLYKKRGLAFEEEITKVYDHICFTILLYPIT